jgi:hypothetical protein
MYGGIVKKLYICILINDYKKNKKMNFSESNKLKIVKEYFKLDISVTNGKVKNQNRPYVTVKCDCGHETDMRLANLNYVFKDKKYTCKSCSLKVPRLSMIGNTYNQKYAYNTDFFKTLTDDSAYILGLLYTDGNLSRPEVNYDYAFKITLHSDDAYLLQKIGLILKGSDKLIRCKIKNRVDIHCNNKEMYQDLISWGLYPNKTATLKVDERLKNNIHFWRGCIDGDGCLCIDKNKQFSMSICGTADICNSFKDFCAQYVSSKASLERRNYVTSFDFSNYTITGKKAQAMYEVLYANTEDKLRLERKFEKGLEYNQYKIDKENSREYLNPDMINYLVKVDSTYYVSTSLDKFKKRHGEFEIVQEFNNCRPAYKKRDRLNRL